MTKEEILKDIRAIDDKDNPLLRCDNEGKALLYAVEKTAERTKEEIFLKVAEWLGRNIHKYAENIRITRLISDLKQAMQDESK